MYLILYLEGEKAINSKDCGNRPRWTENAKQPMLVACSVLLPLILIKEQWSERQKSGVSVRLEELSPRTRNEL